MAKSVAKPAETSGEDINKATNAIETNEIVGNPLVYCPVKDET